LFLDRICTHLIVFEGDQVAKMYLGNWSDYEPMMAGVIRKSHAAHVSNLKPLLEH